MSKEILKRSNDEKLTFVAMVVTYLHVEDKDRKEVTTDELCTWIHDIMLDEPWTFGESADMLLIWYAQQEAQILGEVDRGQSEVLH